MNADTTRPKKQSSTKDLQANKTHFPDLGGKWEMKRLGDICSIRNQKVLPSNIGPDTLCVELDHIGQHNGQLLKYSTAQQSISLKYRFFSGDILFGRLRSYLRKFWLTDQDGICTTEIWPLVAHTEKVDSGFLYAIIQSDQFTEASSISYGTHMPRSDWNVMRNFEVNLPSLTEQRSIAEALSDVDGLLRSLDALIAKKRAIKRAAMQQLLTGKTRLLGLSGAWERRRLGEIVSIGKGQMITESSLKPGIVPVVAGGKKPAYFHNYANRTGKTITVSASGAYAGYVAYWERPIFASDCLTIRDAINYSIQYIFYQMLLRQEEIYRAQTGGAQPHVHGKDLAPLVIPIPLLGEQRSIAAILSDMDAEIAVLERRRNKARAVKRGMMQQLLTGRVRLTQPKATEKRRTPTASARNRHSWQFNEAVIISVLAKRFGDKQYPLGRMRYTKLLYLHHRHKEGHVEGFMKKAAGPYNPGNRYRGPEKIALQKSYIRLHRSGNRQGFVADANIDEAERYFGRWYDDDALEWLEQFRFEKNEHLERLTTVDMAAEKLRSAGKAVSVSSVKAFLRGEPEWRAKLARSAFSDAKLAGAIADCRALFGVGEER